MAEVDVFLSYAAEDEALGLALEAHLSELTRERVVQTSRRRGIPPGGDWSRWVEEQVALARVIVVLVSADYLACDHLVDGELKQALERERRGEARVVPVIVRACDWEEGALGRFDALPRTGGPVTSWANADAAWLAVVQGIREALGSGPRSPHNLRARNTLFRGRKDDLAALEGDLRTEKKATITHASVFGLGGVGKTALALELAHRAVVARAHPGGVWWVAAEGDPVDALVRFAPELRACAPAELVARLPSEGETRAVVIAEQVRLALQGQRAASLVVLDNVSAQGWSKHLPGGAVRVLVTTRDEGLAVGVARRLETLSREQACEVAEAIAGATLGTVEIVARDRVVAVELGGLAVAVEMAARAVRRWFGGSWVAYEGVLRKEMEKVLEDPKLYGEYGRGVFAAIDLSIDKCDADGRALLEGAAVLAPEGMPTGWALAAAGVEAGALAAVRGMAGLKELGLITVDEEKAALSMHRLVHRRVRARAEAERKAVWDEVAERGLACVATWIIPSYSPSGKVGMRVVPSFPVEPALFSSTSEQRDG